MIATMGLSRAVSEKDGNFSRKSQTFLIPLYFAPPPADGVPLELGIGAGGGVKMIEWAYRAGKEV